jgi:TRAP-type C4-dicarboxylate transport system substrate-binding protein
MMKKGIVVLLSLLMVLAVMEGGLSTSQAQQKEGAPIVFKGGHNGTPENRFHKAMLEWSAKVKQMTDGKVIIEVYPAEQLGTEKQMLDNVNLGIIDFSLVGTGLLVDYTPALGIFENAFTFKNTEHFKNTGLNRAFMQKLSQDLESKSNLALMPAFSYLGKRSLLCTKPIYKPEDGKGLKVRVPPVPTYEVVAYALGMTAAPVPFGEAYMAVKQGVVNAVEGIPENIVTMKFYEVAKYYTLTEHMTQAAAVVINKNVLSKKLNDAQRKIFLDTFIEQKIKYFEETDVMNGGFLKKLEGELGTTVIRLDDKAKEPFRKRAIEKLNEKYIPQWGKWWTEFDAMGK